MRFEAVNFFSAFAASFGSMLLVAVLIASWLFRSSAAPLIAKIAVPALIVALACAAPYQVNAVLGFPTLVLPATLPAHAELIAFVSHEDDKRVDLWLRESDGPPRAYETTLNDKLKRTLREAQSMLDHGARVMLMRGFLGKNRTGIMEQRAPDDPAYELDDSALSLPPKA
jgi:hypothetical protein